MPMENIKRIVAVSSCKGGVGKSTVAALLARGLAQKGLKVGLADADLFGPSLPALFHLNQQRVYTDDRNRLIPLMRDGLALMSFGFLLGDAPAVMRGPMVAQYVQQVLINTAWGELDYLLIDMPPGTGDVQLTITQTLRLHGAVIVTTPHNLSLVDVGRGILMFEKVNVPILGVIENMAYFVCEGCAKKHFPFGRNQNSLTDRFGVETLAQWPISHTIQQGLGASDLDPLVIRTTECLLTACEKNQGEQRGTPKIEFDAQKVTLSWPDGLTLCLSNRDLRLSCRCALCVDEHTGEKLLKEETIRKDIAPKEITPLGNYAIAVRWNDGHASGIYPYQQLLPSGID